MIQAANIGTGVALICLMGASVEIGAVYVNYELGVELCSSLVGWLIPSAEFGILGFAFAEATRLFALMMTLLLLYVT